MIRALLLALLLPAASVAAQEATLSTPETLPSPPPVTKLVTSEVYLSRTGGSVTVEFQSSAGTGRRARTFAIASGEMASFITAIDTARSGETGGALRRFNFRVLGWLVDNSKIVDDSAQVIPVTLVP